MADIVRDMKTVVLDIGSGTVKTGLAGCDEPARCFPTIIGQNRYAHGHDQSISVGDRANRSRGVLKLSYPIERGIVTDWDDMESVLSHCHYDKHYNSYNRREHAVLCTETPLNPMSNRQKMCEIMFETFNVPALSFEMPGVLSLYASNRRTGIALDCGEGVTSAVALYDGNVILDSVLRLDLAGRDSTVALEQFVDRKCRFVVNAKREHMREMKEECGYVAPDYNQENTASRINRISTSYTLPDGKSLELDVERFKCAEVLFRPSEFENMEAQTGVHELLHRSLMKCRDGIKDVLCDNIVLTGGSTMFPGFGYRMNKELTKLVYRDHGNQKIEVVAPPKRQNTAWIGGSMMASLSSYHKNFMTLEEYNEDGPNIGSKKSLWINRSQLDIVNEDGMEEDETTRYYYDVFLSFRGADTRQGFTNNLYNALTAEGIKVFRDDDELKIGDKIEVILKAIDNSRICVPVLSPNFANSSWCLREVERMVNLKKDIVPIFFNVTTNDVKLETNLYADALLKHEAIKGKYTVQRWRDALKEIPKLKGRKLRLQEEPMEFIKQIVKEILVKLNFKPRYDIQHLVQVPDQVEGALKLLSIGVGSKRLIAIQGLPGIGKTTLAKVIFNQIHRDFDCSCFLDDVRESLLGSSNLHFLRDALLRALDPKLKDTSIITEPYEKLKTDFRDRNVLIVLDDINDSDQVYDLVGDSSWFGSESSIIITTRDKRVLQGTKEISLYNCYALEMKEMNSKQALELFSKYTFGKHSPPYERWNLAREVVSAAGRLPLALESVGSFLKHQEEQVWKNTINKLKEEPNHALQKKLKQCFDSLDVQQQQMFINIACFFTEDEEKELIYMWEACGFLPEQEINELLSLSMIAYDTDEKCFRMQDQLRHFGRVIARQNLRHLRATNEAWKDKDILCLLDGKMGNEKFEALSFKGSRSEDQVNFSYVAFFNSESLRHIIGDFNGRLQKLEWSSLIDVDALGSNLCLTNVAILCLKRSSVDENWQGWKEVSDSENLKVLDLTECSNLTCVPSYLSEAVNLEKLVLRHCKKLISIASIQRLKKLKLLDVYGCKLLNGLPETLRCLENVYNLHTTPTIFFRGSGQILELKYLTLRGHHQLMKISESIGEFKSLVELDLSDTGISELPWTIGNLSQLQILDLTGCYLLQVLPASLGNLKTLTLLKIEGTSIGWLPFYIRNLKCTVAK